MWVFGAEGQHKLEKILQKSPRDLLAICCFLANATRTVFRERRGLGHGGLAGIGYGRADALLLALKTLFPRTESPRQRPRASSNLVRCCKRRSSFR